MRSDEKEKKRGNSSQLLNKLQALTLDDLSVICSAGRDREERNDLHPRESSSSTQSSLLLLLAGRTSSPISCRPTQEVNEIKEWTTDGMRHRADDNNSTESGGKKDLRFDKLKERADRHEGEFETFFSSPVRIREKKERQQTWLLQSERRKEEKCAVTRGQDRKYWLETVT